MTREDFTALANYVNTSWRGFFSETEVEEFVNTYVDEYDAMQNNRTYISDVLCSLVDGLFDDIQNDDNDVDVRHWFDSLNDLIMRNTYN